MDIAVESPKTLEEIQLLMLERQYEDAKKFKEKSFIWQHPTSQTVEDWCKSKNFKLTKIYTKNPPARLFQYYLITIEE